MMRRSM